MKLRQISMTKHFRVFLMNAYCQKENKWHTACTGPVRSHSSYCPCDTDSAHVLLTNLKWIIPVRHERLSFRGGPSGSSKGRAKGITGRDWNGLESTFDDIHYHDGWTLSKGQTINLRWFEGSPNASKSFWYLNIYRSVSKMAKEAKRMRSTLLSSCGVLWW